MLSPVALFLTFLLAAIMIVLLPSAVLTVAYLYYEPRGLPTEKTPTEPSISILIPTYNEADIIVQKLDELTSLNYPMKQVEIVIVDSSEDETTNKVRNYFEGRAEPTLRLVTQSERRGVASALNEGVKNSTGEVIFRTDADSSLSSNVLTASVETLLHPAIGGVTGRQVDVLGNSIVESDYRNLLSVVQQIETNIDSTFICHGPCFAFKRDLYDPLPENTIADDTETGIRIREQGYRIVMDPKIGFSESGVSGFRTRRQRKDRRAAGLLQTLFRHWDSLGKFGRYGQFVIPLNWLLLAVIPWCIMISMVSITLVGLIQFGLAGLTIPGTIISIFWLGSTERLGALQPIYAVLDSQVSLILAGLSLLRGNATAVWEIDDESREVFRE